MRPIGFTGGRDFWEGWGADRVNEILAANPDSDVLVGDCKTGLDDMVRGACFAANRPAHVFRADWDTHGKAAGPLRNGDIVRVLRAKGGTLYAFPGGRGTADCVRQANASGVTVSLEQAVANREKRGAW